MSKSQELCQELLTCLKHKEETELGLKQLNKQINALMINANEAMTEEEVEITPNGVCVVGYYERELFEEAKNT